MRVSETVYEQVLECTEIVCCHHNAVLVAEREDACACDDGLPVDCV